MQVTSRVTWASSTAYLSIILGVCLRFTVVEADDIVTNHALLVNVSESKASS